MPQKNLAVELLRKLLTEEIKVRSRRNLVQSRLFSEMLQKAILKYQNRAIETAAVIEELVGLARDMREAAKRGEELNLTDDEVAFYDALEVNDSAVKVLGDENLRIIARELVDTVRRNVTIDWTAREAVRARLAHHRKAHLAQARLSTRQTGEGYTNSAGASGVALQGLGNVKIQ